MADHEQLRKALEELRAHLDEMRELDPSVATHLDATIEQARSVLAGQPAGATEAQSVGDQLKDAMLHYEASHPTLAGNLRSVIDALAQIGI